MKIYRKSEETKQELKKPQIRLVDKRLYAISENGQHICILVDFRDCTFPPSAKLRLVAEMYSTDWAEWDNEGRMTKLLEDFE
jgi:hypothetical protein